MTRNKSLLGAALLTALILLSCGLPSFQPTATQPEAGTAAPTTAGSSLPPCPPGAAQGVLLLSGEFNYTNEFYPEGYAYEHAVALLDLTGFVLRDREWEIPVDSQVIGYVDLQPENNRGVFRLALPAVPFGELNDVDNNGQADEGVQIFALEYSPNWTGGPFYEGDDPYLGWPSYLASVKTDRENQDEINGGKLIVWAPDDQQQFPIGFGPDGLLFTADDLVGALPAGYSVIDLDQQPFAILRDAEVRLALYEPEDAAITDLSALSYPEAFERMFAVIRKEYAFNGIQDKHPDWDELYAGLLPQVKEAEQKEDAFAFYLALRQYELAFRDGHVSLDGGSIDDAFIRSQILNGYGFAIRELDDGKSIVIYVTPGGPAAIAGIQRGAEIINFNGEPVAAAISKVEPFSPQSTDYGLRAEQALFLPRAPFGDTATVTFANPGRTAETATLTAVQEVDSFFAAYPGAALDDTALPVEYRILDANIGYIKINSNSDDLNLTYRIFERALNIFQQNRTAGLIVDMRLNLGGASLGLAGFLSDREIVLGQLEYFSEKSGKFEPEGPPDKVRPNRNQYRFDNMVLLIDQTCYSACEIEAYGFSQVPGMIVMGHYPTGGVEAEVARGRFDLPEGMSFQVPTGRYTLPDGSIFLEGVGVQPTVRIPITAEAALSEGDPVLEAAQQAILSSQQ